MKYKIQNWFYFIGRPQNADLFRNSEIPAEPVLKPEAPPSPGPTGSEVTFNARSEEEEKSGAAAGDVKDLLLKIFLRRNREKHL